MAHTRRQEPNDVPTADFNVDNNRYEILPEGRGRDVSPQQR